MDTYSVLLQDLAVSTERLFDNASPEMLEEHGLSRRFVNVERADQHLRDNLNEHLNTLRAWTPSQPISASDAFLSFLIGDKWVTASDQQNWFGLLPLFAGSLLVCTIALLIAAPTGIGAAIYVNQLAKPKEKALIKPFIEFISAMPTVVLGFFGVMIFGEFLREITRVDALAWLPFFPIQERLNAFTAGSLLGLVAIPTIFSLTEEALNAVPESVKEASYSVGATKLQTTWRTMVPIAFPGIVAAVTLGLGRVIGETMVVLLCAGNRVKIPELEGSLALLFEPVHTMTGMIAKEMGEVVYGSLHYHALFMVGFILFIASLIINYTARNLARRGAVNQPF